MRISLGIILILLSSIFFTKDAFTVENSTDIKALKDYFLNVAEITQPEEFLGILATDKTKSDVEYYMLITEENGREVLSNHPVRRRYLHSMPLLQIQFLELRLLNEKYKE